MEKAAQADRFKLGTLTENAGIISIAKSLKYRTVEELIAAIGYGDHSAEQIYHRVRAALRDNKGVDPKSLLIGSDGQTISGPAASLIQRKVNLMGGNGDHSDSLEFSLSSEQSRVDVAQGDLLNSLARCCAPIPGDEIIGYVTRGRGISVHRADCSNIRQYREKEPERLVIARWKGAPDKSFQALVAMECEDRPGLLHDVTGVFSGRHVNICGVNTYPLKNNRARLNIAATISNSEELEELMAVLRTVQGAVEVHRV